MEVRNPEGDLLEYDSCDALKVMDTEFAANVLHDLRITHKCVIDVVHYGSQVSQLHDDVDAVLGVLTIVDDLIELAYM